MVNLFLCCFFSKVHQRTTQSKLNAIVFSWCKRQVKQNFHSLVYRVFGRPLNKNPKVLQKHINTKERKKYQTNYHKTIIGMVKAELKKKMKIVATHTLDAHSFVRPIRYIVVHKSTDSSSGCATFSHVLCISRWFVITIQTTFKYV